MRWPTDPAALEALQRELAGRRPPPWSPPSSPTVGGCFVCFPRGSGGPGAAGDPGWAAAVVVEAGRVRAGADVVGEAGAEYRPGLLAGREGRLLAAAVGALPCLPDVLLVNATGRDHPRRAGLALQLGWALEVPSIGVTHRPLLAVGRAPGPGRGDAAALWIGAEQVGWWVRTRAGARPVAVSPGWRTDLFAALETLRTAASSARTPEAIRQARRRARRARSQASQQA